MGRKRDLTNQRFGRQVAIKSVGVNKFGNYLWLCRCDCGKEHVVPSGKLVQGKSKSCGCLSREVSTKLLEKHGITTGGSPRTLIIWKNMKARVLNPKSISYPNYGGRGIKICDDWLVFKNFHYWALENGYADDLEIDRIDNDGDYCPENCRWVPHEVNRLHQRRTIFIEINGTIKTFSEWCKLGHISRATGQKLREKGINVFKQYFIEKFKKEQEKEKKKAELAV